jgi:AcrR family transcriptional regulator
LALRPQTLLEPRKTPVQARSAASVEAILEATVQVLLSVGKERLTTTRVASRAGVSVGTLYQYFPNKSALLKAALKRHLDEVTEEIERVCREQKGVTLRQMADGAAVVKQMGMRSNQAIVGMLQTSSEPLAKDPQLVAEMLQGAMAGISRRLLESSAPEKLADGFRQELVALACAYLEVSSGRVAGHGAGASGERELPGEIVAVATKAKAGKSRRAAYQ